MMIYVSVVAGGVLALQSGTPMTDLYLVIQLWLMLLPIAPTFTTMKTHLISLTLSLALFLFTGLALAQEGEVLPEGWQHLHETDGTDLYFKASDDGSRTYKSVATVNAQLPDITAQLTDVTLYIDWLSPIGTLENMGNESDGSTNLYLLLNTPALGKSHDMVCNLTFSQSEAAIIGRFTNHADLKPAMEGVVRVPFFSGFVVARQISADECKLTLQCEIAFGQEVDGTSIDFEMRKFLIEAMRTLQREFDLPLVQEITQ